MTTPLCSDCGEPGGIYEGGRCSDCIEAWREEREEREAMGARDEDHRLDPYYR